MWISWEDHRGIWLYRGIFCGKFGSGNLDQDFWTQLWYISGGVMEWTWPFFWSRVLHREEERNSQHCINN